MTVSLPKATRKRCLALLLIFVLAGCAGRQLPEMPRLPQIDWRQLPLPPLPWLTGDEEAPPEIQTVEVLVWSEGDSATANLQALLDEFQQQRPDLHLQLTVSKHYESDLRLRLESDRPPDLLAVDSLRFPDLAAAGDLARPAGRLDAADDFYATLRAAFTFEETLYCLPREFRTLALVYDPARFAQAGLSPPTTWGELRAAAEALTDANDGVFGLIVAPDLSRWLPFLYQAGGRVTTADGRAMALNSPQALTALNYYIDVFRENFAGQPAESNSEWAGEVLGKGKGAMAVEGNWVAPYLAAQFPGKDYAFALLPAGPTGRGTVAFSSCYAVTADSPHQSAAFELANFLTSPMAMRKWPGDGATMPSRISLRDEWLAQFPHLAPFLNGIDDAHPWRFFPGFDAVLRTFNRSLLQLFNADIAPEDLLAEVEQVGEGVLSRQPLPAPRPTQIDRSQ